MIDAGESVVVVAARLGDTEREVLRTYAHLLPDDADRTRRIMEAVFAAEPTQEHTGSRGITAVHTLVRQICGTRDRREDENGCGTRRVHDPTRDRPDDV